tara:strand:- start:1552 stop:2550 length:999 start_codon:yes stop_codon:yes gene_type:complete
MKNLQSFKRGWLVAILFLLSQQGSAQINPSDYEYTMSVTAVLRIDGIPSTNTSDKIYIKNEDDLIGEASFNVAIPSFGNYAFLTVYSNASTTDEVYYYNATSGLETQLEEDLSFSSNDILGSISDPYVFNVWSNNSQIDGCTDETAFNYDSLANNNDGSCSAVVLGCINSESFNYNSAANTDNGSCMAVIEGCLNEAASNYNQNANTDNASCVTWETAFNSSQISVGSLTETNELQLTSILTLNSELETQNATIQNLQTDLSLAQANVESHTLVTRALNLREGSSMFGYSCSDSVDVSTALTEYSTQIALVKDDWGLTWLPEYNFNDLGSLQ